MSECKEADEIKDLANKIDALVRSHSAYSMCYEITTNCTDYLNCKANLMKLRRK